VNGTPSADAKRPASRPIGRPPLSGVAPWVVVGTYAAATSAHLLAPSPYDHGALIGAGVVLFLSLFAFATFAYDKRRAANEATRVAERTLHLLVFSGGAAGALLAMALVRHKNRKTSFRILAPLALFLHVVIIGWWGLS
jgi:uncharacterized membrane protein YsdA (DUF1294 family)